MTVAYLTTNHDRNRYYNPSLGRFISSDPSRFKNKDTNLYRYVGNNPLIYVDYTGEGRSGVGNKELEAWQAVIEIIVEYREDDRLRDLEKRNRDFNKKALRLRLLEALDKGMLEEIIKKEFPFIDFEKPPEDGLTPPIEILPPVVPPQTCPKRRLS